MSSDNYYAKGKYSSEIARRYDTMREAAGERYEAEDELIGGYIANLPEGASVLDAPVGTGRFIPLFKARNCIIHGVDISQDMLTIATDKAAQTNTEVNLRIGDITDLEFDDGEVDYFLSNKFIKWLPSSAHALRALRELRRVSVNGGLVEIRCVDHFVFEIFGHHAGTAYNIIRALTGKSRRNTKIYAKKHARELIHAAGFKITREQILSKHRRKSIYFFLT